MVPHDSPSQIDTAVTDAIEDRDVECEALSVARLLDVFNMHCAAKVARVRSIIGQHQEAHAIYEQILPKLTPTDKTLAAELQQQQHWHEQRRHHSVEQHTQKPHTHRGETLMVGPRERGMLLSDAAGVLRQLNRLDEAITLWL